VANQHPAQFVGVRCPGYCDIVAINDVLPLKAARRGAIANLKYFAGPEHQWPNFDSFIYIHYAAHIIRLTSAKFWQRLAKFVWLPFADVSSGVDTRGSGGSMNRGPRAPGGPSVEPQKFMQENN